MVTDSVSRIRQRQCVVDLVALPCRADEHRRGTQPPDRKQDSDELGPVGSHYGNTLSCSSTDCGQGRSQPVSQHVELRQAEAPFLEHERDLLGHVPSFPGRPGCPDIPQLLEKFLSLRECNILYTEIRKYAGYV